MRSRNSFSPGVLAPVGSGSDETLLFPWRKEEETVACYNNAGFGSTHDNVNVLQRFGGLGLLFSASGASREDVTCASWSSLSLSSASLLVQAWPELTSAWLLSSATAPTGTSRRFPIRRWMPRRWPQCCAIWDSTWSKASILPATT